MPGIIVGVEESDHARHALRWAMREAVLHQAPLTVVTVRPAAVRPATMSFWGLRAYSGSRDDENLVRSAVRELVDDVAREIGGTTPAVTISVTSGNPAEELVNASRDADMLVVGSRGGGGFGGLRMGVGEQPGDASRGLPVVVIPDRAGH
jgi:nucleotide-binding universal stress UspA family protein